MLKGGCHPCKPKPCENLAIKVIAQAGENCRVVIGSKLLVAIAFLVVPYQAVGFQFSAPSSSSLGEFNVSYSNNNRYHVILVELSNGHEVVVNADVGNKSSNEIRISKPNGTYGYYFMRCHRVTFGAAGSCISSGVRTVNVSRSSSRPSITLSYEYDPLGRLVAERQGNTMLSGYCYDEAGNRKYVRSGENRDPCEQAELDEPASPDEPSPANARTHSGAGWAIYWTTVEGAARYYIGFLDGTRETRQVINDPEQSAYFTNSLVPRPQWVQACDSNWLCSDKVNF